MPYRDPEKRRAVHRKWRADLPPLKRMQLDLRYNATKRAKLLKQKLEES